MCGGKNQFLYIYPMVVLNKKGNNKIMEISVLAKNTKYSRTCLRRNRMGESKISVMKTFFRSEENLPSYAILHLFREKLHNSRLIYYFFHGSVNLGCTFSF